MLHSSKIKDDERLASSYNKKTILVTLQENGFIKKQFQMSLKFSSSILQDRHSKKIIIISSNKIFSYLKVKIVQLLT